jgi:hypothetical protein
MKLLICLLLIAGALAFLVFWLKGAGLLIGGSLLLGWLTRFLPSRSTSSDKLREFDAKQESARQRRIPMTEEAEAKRQAAREKLARLEERKRFMELRQRELIEAKKRSEEAEKKSHEAELFTQAAIDSALNSDQSDAERIASIRSGLESLGRRGNE